MSRSIRDIAKKRGRPKTTGLGEGVLVRMHEPMLSRLDAWCEANGVASRPEGLRQLAERTLAAESAPAKPAPKRVKRKSE
jgi:hypothetical protein